MAYYYLLSSLPMLQSDGDMPLSYDQFLDLCRDTVPGTKYEMLKELTLSSTEGPLVSKWAEFYSIFKEELTYQRNVRLGRSAQPPTIREDRISKLVAAAMSHPNPLAAEQMLLAFQFEKLDELIGTHYFDDSALMGYGLKLRLLQRKNSFQPQTGKAEFDRILHTLQQQIMSMEQE